MKTTIGNTCTCPNGPMPGHYVGCPLAGDFGIPLPMPPEPERYDIDETVEVLATAMVLVQSYGYKLWGMSPSMWVDDAVSFRAKVQATGDAFWKDET